MICRAVQFLLILCLAACAANLHKEPRFKRPPYAFPVNREFSAATQMGPELFEVRCGNDQFQFDISNGFGMFYKQDGTLKTQQEFCEAMRHSRDKSS